MAETLSSLELQNVSKRYGVVDAVRDLRFTVDQGEVVTLIGPSGCGKTTTLRLIAGLERPTSGTILIAGEVVAGSSWHAPERRRVGLVFQDHALFPHLDVAANIAFGLHRFRRDRRRARMAEVLDLVQLGPLTTRYPHELSGGEQQRVALARALAPQPAVVLLDEPFSSLDESLRATVRADTIAVLRETETTAILVTHDQTEALSVSDRVVVLRDGGVEQVDTPVTVFESPATRFVASFMGDADFLPARPNGAGLICEIGIVSTTPGWGPDEQVEVVLRPHEVTVTASPHGTAHVVAVEYRGAFVPHTIRLQSGRTVRSWQPHSVRYPVGTQVEVSLAPGETPTLLLGNRAVTGPTKTSAPHGTTADP